MRPQNFNTHVTSRLILLLFLLYRATSPVFGTPNYCVYCNKISQCNKSD
jgi:hypothetical protein